MLCRLFFQRNHCWWLFFYVILLFQNFPQQGFVLADLITVTKSTQGLYDQSPKLRIRGNGFTEDASDISLVLGTNSYNPLKMNEDYIVTKDSDNNGLILKLLPERRWADLTSPFTSPPLSLTLYKVFFPNISGDLNLLLEPVIVASVLRTPTVDENPDLTIYRSLSEYLKISGEGWVGGTGKVSLYFSPSIIKDITYEDRTNYPLRSNEITLRLRETYSWRVDPGPLRLVGIDTGAGPVKLLGLDGGGVIVAQVMENPDPNTVIVDPTATTQMIYHSRIWLEIHGKNFNFQQPSSSAAVVAASTATTSTSHQTGLSTNYDHIQLEFFPPLDRGNYTITSCSATRMTLQLKQPPSLGWRTDVENLPAPLFLISINGIGVGPNHSRAGVPIATIFESISIDKSDQSIYKSQTRSFNITGKGFPVPSTGYHPIIKFSPEVAAPYQITVLSRTLLQVSIPDGSNWLARPGSLSLQSFNPVDAVISPGIHSFTYLTVAKVIENENYRGLLPQPESQSVLIQFDVSLTTYESTCLPVFGVFVIPERNEGFVEMMIHLEMRTEYSTLHLSDLLLYFPGSNDYIGHWIPPSNNNNNNNNRHEEFGSNKVGEWPTSFKTYKPNNGQCTTATFSTLRLSNNISEICFSSICSDTFGECTLKERFRGQLQLNSIEIINPEPVNTPFPFTPCRFDALNTPTIVPTAAPTRSLAPSPSPQEAKNYISSQVNDHYTLIQFDVMLGYGRPFCQPIFPLTNHSIYAYDQLTLKFQYELTKDGDPHWLSDLQVYFPGTSYYYGNCFSCNSQSNSPWSPTSTIPLGIWPSTWSGNQRKLDTCYSTSTYLSSLGLRFSEICVVNTCYFCSSSLQRFRGQLKIEAKQMIAVNEEKLISQRQVLPEIPCTFNAVPTISPSRAVSSSPVTIRSSTVRPTTFGTIPGMSFHSFSNRMLVSFDAILQLNQALCTSTFEGSIPLDPAIPVLSFAYEVYSLSDNDEGFLEIYFPENNLWFFANNHYGQCYSYEQIIDFPLNFNQICIRKSCRHEPCISANSSSSSSSLHNPARYRGSILLTGYRSPTITSPNTKEEEESFKPFICAGSDLQEKEDDGFWTKEMIFDWSLRLGFGFIVMLIIGVIYCRRYYQSRGYYDDDDFDTPRRRNPIPVMMEMVVSPLYRNTRRNPRLSNTLFAIPSNIMIPDQESHAMDIGLTNTSAPSEKERIMTMQSHSQMEYQPLTSSMEEAEVEDEVPEGLAVVVDVPSIGPHTTRIEDDEAKV